MHVFCFFVQVCWILCLFVCLCWWWTNCQRCQKGDGMCPTDLGVKLLPTSPDEWHEAATFDGYQALVPPGGVVGDSFGISAIWNISILCLFLLMYIYIDTQTRHSKTFGVSFGLPEGLHKFLCKFIEGLPTLTGSLFANFHRAKWPIWLRECLEVHQNCFH